MSMEMLNPQGGYSHFEAASPFVVSHLGGCPVSPSSFTPPHDLLLLAG